MPRSRTEFGYEASKFNRLQHGVMVRGFLPSRGPEHCPLSRTCPIANDPSKQANCIPGGECPYEQMLHAMYLESARSTFSFCLAWLSPTEFEQTITELGFLEIRRMRLSALTAREGLTRPKTHPVSGVAYGVREALGAGRYATAIDNEFNVLMARVLSDQEEAPRTSRQ